MIRARVRARARAQGVRVRVMLRASALDRSSSPDDRP